MLNLTKSFQDSKEVKSAALLTLAWCAYNFGIFISCVGPLLTDDITARWVSFDYSRFSSETCMFNELNKCN